MSHGYVDPEARRVASQLFQHDQVTFPAVEEPLNPGSPEALSVRNQLKPYYYSRLARLISPILDHAFAIPLARTSELPSDDPWEDLQDDVAQTLRYGIDRTRLNTAYTNDMKAAQQLHTIRNYLQTGKQSDMHFSLLGGAGTAARVVTGLIKEQVVASEASSFDQKVPHIRRRVSDINTMASINTMQLVVLQGALEKGDLPPLTHTKENSFKRSGDLLTRQLVAADVDVLQEALGSPATAATLEELKTNAPVVGCPVLLVRGAVKRLHEYTLTAAIDRQLV